MNIKKRITVTFALTVLFFSFTLNVFGQSAADQPSEVTQFGMHTMTAGQVLRLGIVNRMTVPDLEPPLLRLRARIVFDIYEAVPPDRVRLRFKDRVEHELILNPGEAASFDLPSSRMGGERVSVAVLISLDDAYPPTPIRLGSGVSLEVRDNKGTLFTLPGVIKGFNPQPEPPMPARQ